MIQLVEMAVRRATPWWRTLDQSPSTHVVKVRLTGEQRQRLRHLAVEHHAREGVPVTAEAMLRTALLAYLDRHTPPRGGHSQPTIPPGGYDSISAPAPAPPVRRRPPTG